MFSYTPLFLGIFIFFHFGSFSLSETFCPNIPINNIASLNDNQEQSSKPFRFVQYNVEWLFMDYFAASDCPGNGCTWKNTSEASTHLDYVSDVISTLQPDFINFCEIEGCDELQLINSQLGSQYTPYIIQGADTSTGQNVGFLTKIGPTINLYRTENRITYPIPGSRCGYTGSPGTSGVSKHYITEFAINGIKIAFIGAHLLAFPTDPTRCAEREAQSMVLRDIIAGYLNRKYEIIIMGDFNDFDENPMDANDNKPLSQVLDILKVNDTLYNVASKIAKVDRFSDWYDKNDDCKSTPTEFSMIDHILVTKALLDKVSDVFIYHGYDEFCGKYNSDHYPVVMDIML
jgi:exonuclease III